MIGMDVDWPKDGRSPLFLIPSHPVNGDVPSSFLGCFGEEGLDLRLS